LEAKGRMVIATFRFYEELNDYLSDERKKRDFSIRFHSGWTARRVMEYLGVDHRKVDLILVNGDPVDLSYEIKDGDRVSVYPVFESFDISSIKPSGSKPLREVKFILDIHLEALARRLGVMGFDVLYKDRIDPSTLISISIREKRILLTRRKWLLRQEGVTRAILIKGISPKEQVQEIIDRLDLYSQIGNTIHPVK